MLQCLLDELHQRVAVLGPKQSVTENFELRPFRISEIFREPLPLILFNTHDREKAILQFDYSPWTKRASSQPRGDTARISPMDEVHFEVTGDASLNTYVDMLSSPASTACR